MTARAARFPLFDSLRALAALSVLLYHALASTNMVDWGFGLPGLERFVAHLNVGVTIFFLISGFLLYRPFARARLEREPLPAVGAYAWRRVLRIVPAYWVALTLVALWLSLPGVFEAHNALRYYGFAQIYWPGTSLGGIGQAWTLCVEATFYIFLPVWALAMRRVPARDGRAWLRTELAGLAVLVIVSEAYKAWALQHVGNPNTPQAAPYLMPLPSFLDDFAIGMALAVGVLALEAGLLARSRALALLRRAPSLPWLVAGAAFVASGWLVGLPGFGGLTAERGDVFPTHALYALIALGVVLPGVTFGGAPHGVARRVLALRPLLWIGLVSYGVYLWHFAITDRTFHWVGQTTNALASTGVVLLIVLGTLIAGALSYYLVERPALALKRRARDSDQPGAASAPLAPPAA